jgi:methylmalonyl-CoA mutase N-terminal domain/subunit
LKALKSKRDNEKVAACLKKIREDATKNENLMPVVIESVENFCTLGEISDALRSVFGEYK